MPLFADMYVVLGSILVVLVSLSVGFFLGLRRSRAERRALQRDLSTRSIEMLEHRSRAARLEKSLNAQPQHERVAREALGKLAKERGNASQRYLDLTSAQLAAAESEHQARRYARVASLASERIKALEAEISALRSGPESRTEAGRLVTTPRTSRQPATPITTPVPGRHGAAAMPNGRSNASPTKASATPAIGSVPKQNGTGIASARDSDTSSGKADNDRGAMPSAGSVSSMTDARQRPGSPADGGKDSNSPREESPDMARIKPSASRSGGLLLIEGLAEDDEFRLNELGIHDIAQLARLSESEQKSLRSLIDEPSGPRPVGVWVGNARALLRSQSA